jgi:hypothetical protein
MILLYVSLLLAVLLMLSKSGKMKSLSLVVLCIAAVLIYREKESYIVRYNVKDISTFLL